MTRRFFPALLAGVLLAAAPAAAAPPAAPADRAAPRALEGEVTAVSVVPGAGQAEVVISLRGSADVRDFVLRDPDRLVVDVVGATLGGTASRTYDGTNRAGILNVRASQFRPGVVRVVVELDALRNYRVEQVGETVRVTFGTDEAFEAWSTATPAELDAPPSRPARAAAPARQPEVGLAPARAAAAPPGDRRITISWDKASIADVVTGFASYSGRTIILGKGITGEVTAEIKDQPWTDAFQAILSAQGLSAQELPGGIIRVDNPAVIAAADSTEPLETSVLSLNYARPTELARAMEGMVTKRGKVVTDSATNSVIVTDTRSRVKSLTEFARGLDVRTRQVAIQAKIIFVDRTDLEQLGLKYDLGGRTQFFNKLVQRTDPTTGQPYNPNVQVIDLGGQSISGIGNADQTIIGSALDLVYSATIGRFTLTSFLTALERVEMLDIQAEPVITTLDNRKADILVGEETPIRVIDAGSSTVGQPARANVTFRETGIRLTVTPHVTNNRQIWMQLRTERSALQPLAAADLGYNFQKQTAENQLLVSDGETAVIGGLTVTEVSKTRSGMPLLSRLPLVGGLFSFTSDQERRRDLVILVTPRILEDVP